MGPKSPHQRIASNQPEVSFFFFLSVLWFGKFGRFVPFVKQWFVLEFMYSSKKRKISKNK